MNSLPRMVAMALFVVLAALVALLAMPVWRNLQVENSSGAAAIGGAGHGTAPARAVVLSQRVALTFAVGALALAAVLLLGMAARPVRNSDSRQPFAAARTEFGALARLAESSVAQGEELNRERDVRRRAEEDARLQQQLLTQALDEKIRLGRDLHDGIIQSLYAAGLTLESVRARLTSNPAEAEALLDKARAGLNEAIRDVRAYIVGLAPENLRRAGFTHALRALVGEFGTGRDAEFEIKIDEEAAALLSPQQSVETLQIAREAVSNALRHGAASRVTIRLHRSDHELCLLVQDNGAGFNQSRAGEGGHGLGNMRARAVRLGANLRVTSQPGDGTRVLATLPILQPSIV